MDSGPIVGAALLVGLSEGLRMAKEMAPLFFGGILILVIFWLPGGLLTLPVPLLDVISRQCYT